jgi:peroxiredoxin Q/BCP
MIGNWIKKQIFSQKLDEGTKAPEFRCPDQNGAEHTLSQYLGRWVVLYFYPKDFTYGCTAEACSFRDNFTQFVDQGVAVVGVSTDSVESHRKFADAQKIPYPLLADTSKTICRAYGTLTPLGFSDRVTFLIDPQGIIRARLDWVNWFQYASSVLQKLKELR